MVVNPSAGRPAPGAEEDEVAVDDAGQDAATLLTRDPSGSLSAVEFANTARLIGDVARTGGLRAPGFSSPPRRPEIDRSIRRNGTRAVVAVRRRGRPASAIQADLIEGVVVANELDPFEAARFRAQAWAALALGWTVASVPTGGDEREAGTPVGSAEVVDEVAPVIALGEVGEAA